MRISLIIAYYKDIQALELIIQSLKHQNYNDLEVIVAEDNNEQRTIDYLNTITDINIKHTSQSDAGVRKARSLNNAILKSTGDYLIFIDGDCLPHSKFVSAHAILAEPGYMLSGRRVNLGKRFSQALRKHTISQKFIEVFYMLLLPLFILDGATHAGQGFALKPTGWLYNKVQATRKSSNLNLLGCNFSCYKKDMVLIDGFDESYGATAVADDTDLEWRFKKYGLKAKTCKNAANVFHLYHTISTLRNGGDDAFNKMKARKEAGNYSAVSGLSSHKEETL